MIEQMNSPQTNYTWLSNSTNPTSSEQ